MLNQKPSSPNLQVDTRAALSRNGSRWLIGVAAIAVVLVVAGLWSGTRSTSDAPPETPAHEPTRVVSLSDQTVPAIVSFCSACHVMPKPDSFPKAAWYDEVKRGYDFYYQSGRTDLSPPLMQTVVEYFRTRAPETLVIRQSQTVPGSNRISFRSAEIFIPRTAGEFTSPAISFVGRWPRSLKLAPDLLVSDMAGGGVFWCQPTSPENSLRRIAILRNPAAASICDLNGNGDPDLVVADLGSFQPADHNQGRVIWLPDFQNGGQSQVGQPLCENMGRVADVQPADFDGDGDLDLVVAEFGWHKTGRVLWLRNDGDARSPQFVPQVLDTRPGAIHVPVVDLNQDGRPDFVALISQEFEVIEAFLNRGNGVFEKQRLSTADDPAFGSSGIQLVDLDGDGDQDVLYANGDTFDSSLIKPYHGIQWLENTGSFPFVLHRLTSMPGVHRALAGDLDGDGDLDLVAASLLPATTRNEPSRGQLDSLIWLEQRQPGQFLRHVLETGNCVHAAIELADFDNDGDLDIATGWFMDRKAATQSAVTIWWNELR